MKNMAVFFLILGIWCMTAPSYAQEITQNNNEEKGGFINPFQVFLPTINSFYERLQQLNIPHPSFFDAFYNNMADIDEEDEERNARVEKFFHTISEWIQKQFGIELNIKNILFAIPKIIIWIFEKIIGLLRQIFSSLF